MLTFNAASKLIIVSGTSLDVKDMYSKWKEWVATSDNSKYPEAFSVTGGDTIDASAGTSIPCYAFLLNGWKVRPQESSHTLNVTNGILLVDGGGDPFVNTVGSYVVRINYSQPVQAITVATGGGSGGSLTQQQVRDAMSLTPSSGDNSSIDEEISKIKKNTNLIPGLF